MDKNLENQMKILNKENQKLNEDLNNNNKLSINSYTEINLMNFKTKLQ